MSDDYSDMVSSEQRETLRLALVNDGTIGNSASGIVAALTPIIGEMILDAVAGALEDGRLEGREEMRDEIWARLADLVADLPGVEGED